MSSILIGGIVMSLLMMESWWNTCIKPFWFWIIYSIGFYYLTVRMAERSKALRSGRSPVFWARVRIPLLTLVHGAFHIIVLHSSTVNFFCDILKVNEADVAEWLRRLTRNQFPSGSVGSNPTICAAFGIFSLHKCIFTLWRPKSMYFKGMSLTTTSMKLRRLYERRIVVCNSVCLISPWKIQLF